MIPRNSKYHAPVLAALAVGTLSTADVAHRVGITAGYAASILGLLSDRGHIVRVTVGRPHSPATWKLSGQVIEQRELQPRVNIQLARPKAAPMPARTGQPETVEEWTARTGNVLEQLPGVGVANYLTVPAYPGRG